MSRLAIIEIHKDELRFSAGHLMLFSATHRESLHGHDYQVSAAFNTEIHDNGLSFDCREYKERLAKLCQSLDYRFILPRLSRFLTITDTDTQWLVNIGHECLSFYKSDAILLPICNVSLEELSYWFLQQLVSEKTSLQQHCIKSITLKVSNGRNESAQSSWEELPARS